MKAVLFLFFAIPGAGIFLPGTIYAHGVDVYDVTKDSGAGIVRFMYSTGEPMMYAKVKLYPPSRPDVESLQSITDRNGVFAFIPDEEGEWRIDAEDGMGHKGTISIGAGAPEAAGTGAESGGGDSGSSKSGGGKNGVPLALGIVTGLSLILNIFSGWHFGALLARSRKGGVYAHQ
jgi:nickel transport protein